MKKLVALGFALFLGACSILPTINNPIGNDQLATAISVYGISQTAVIAYGSLPRCTLTNLPTVTNWCYKRSVLVKAREYDKEANIAVNTAVQFRRDYPTLDASAYINAAVVAVNVLKDFNKSNGVE